MDQNSIAGESAEQIEKLTELLSAEKQKEEDLASK